MRDYTNYRHNRLQRALLAILRLLVKILMDLEVTGLENVPPNGPVILICNHISFLEPVIAVGLLSRPTIPMSKIENFDHKIVGPIARLFDAFPVRRGEVDRRALQTALRVLEGGTALWITPEGTRSKSGQLQRGLNGLAYIATRSGAPVVPMAFTGTDQFKHNIRRLKRTPVNWMIGQPFHLGQDQPHARGDALDELTDKAMRQIAALLPPELRGVYGDDE